MVVLLPWLCHFAILVSLGGGGVVNAGKVPGVNLEKVKVWDESASKEAWEDLDGYLDWRSYTLDRLSDLGYLDHLLDAMDDPLREIDDVGKKTGIES